MSADKGQSPFKQTSAVSGGPGQPPLVRTGRAEVDQLIDLLGADGYTLRDMLMPFPLVVIGLHNKAANAFALIISKDNDEPAQTPTGLTVTEPVVFMGTDTDETPPEPVTVKAYLTARKLGLNPGKGPRP